MSTTLRVDESTRDRVNRLGAQTQQSVDRVVSRALDAYEDALYWQRWREAQGGTDRAAYDAEQVAWDRASAADQRW